MSAPVLPAARVGDRHTHSARLDDREAGALLSVLTGAMVASTGQGGVSTAVVGAGVGGGGGGGAIAMRDVIPNDTSGAVAEGSPRTLFGADGLGAALAEAEPLDCRRHKDGPIRMGSMSVFVDGFRVARVSDQTKCGAMLCDGEKTVLIGGAPADGAPPDPLAVVAGGAALAGAAIGNAIAVGTASVSIATRWAETLTDRAASTVESATNEIEAAAGCVAANAGKLVSELSEVSGSLLGVLMGRS